MSSATTAAKKGSHAGHVWKNYKGGLFLGVLAITFAALFFISIIPYTSDSYQYNQKIGTYITYAGEAQTFQQINANLIKAEIGINSSFDSNQTTTYDNPFFWSHVYDKSIASDMAYIKSIQVRIAIYNATYTDMIHNSTAVIQTQDWYANSTKTIQNLVSDGGFSLNGRLQGAYILHFGNPLDYWIAYFGFFITPFGVSAPLITVYEHDNKAYHCYCDWCKSQ